METIELPSSTQGTPSQIPSPENKNRPSRGRTLPLAFLAVFFGLIGGIVSPWVRDALEARLPLFHQKVTKTPSASDKVRVVAEDNVVADLVEKNSAGVVTIVITKDVPRVRSFFNNPFFPFFSPFQGQNQEQGGNKQQIGSGSGFFVSSDGLIVTNKHVVSDEDAEYTVIVRGKDEYKATVLARDPNNDLAVLKIKGENFPALSLGDSDKVRVGETAIAIGNPLGEFANSVSKGIISGLSRDLDASSGMGDTERLSGILQTDAAINPGNSGGPLFNLSGEVIGINVAMAQGAENIGFALPINQVKSTIDQVKTTGKISVPYIGVRYVMINEDIQKNNNLPVDHGALIARGQQITDFAVIPGSPADKAGLVENDIILEVNGEKLDNDNLLSSVIAQHKVGDELTLKVWHKGDTKEVKVKLEERKQ